MDAIEDGAARVALVTGAGRGIGFEVCRLLGQRGMTVILTARGADKAEAAARQLAGDGLDIRPKALNICDDESVRRVAAELAGEFGRLDVLVNNAAGFVDWSETAAGADLAAARALFETNLFGTWRVCQAFLPLIRWSDHGRIVIVSSGAGSHGDSGSA